MKQQSTTHDECLLTYEEVCALTKISPATLRRYVQAGKFPTPIKPDPNGRAVRFRLRDVQVWLSQL